MVATRHAGYHVSQRTPPGAFGRPLVDWQLTFAATAYNLVRLRTPPGAFGARHGHAL